MALVAHRPPILVALSSTQKCQGHAAHMAAILGRFPHIYVLQDGCNLVWPTPHGASNTVPRLDLTTLHSNKP